MDEGEPMPNLKAALKEIREHAAAGFSGYKGFRESGAFEDRREEPWPTAAVRTGGGGLDELPQTLSPKEIERRHKEQDEISLEAALPSSKMARDLGRDDIRKLTKEEVLQSIFDAEATGPDPTPAKRKRR
jgi:hypothetical protein